MGLILTVSRQITPMLTKGICFMRNPWPMFCVLAVTGVLCVSFPTYTVWILVLAVAAAFFACLLLPIKFDDWFARKINPCIQAYQQDHNFETMERELNRWRPWALTKAAKNAVQVNLLCALFIEKRWADAADTLEQIKQRSKTAVDQMNYHLLMTEYAQQIGDTALEQQERQRSEALKTKIETKLRNPKLPASAQQSRTAFLCWISFVAFLFLGGGVWIYLFRTSSLKWLGVNAVICSWFAAPVAVVWLVLWLVRRKRAQTAHSKEDAI